MALRPFPSLFNTSMRDVNDPHQIFACRVVVHGDALILGTPEIPVQIVVCVGCSLGSKLKLNIAM